MLLNFEWDEEKNRANIRKHGFDFADAHEIFDLPLLVGADERKPYGEDRCIGIGFLRQRVVVIVFVELPDDTIRVVSVRKALKHERERFAEFLRNQLDAS